MGHRRPVRDVQHRQPGPEPGGFRATALHDCPDFWRVEYPPGRSSGLTAIYRALGTGVVKLSVIVPTANEAPNIEQLVNRVAAACRALDAEIIFADYSGLVTEWLEAHPQA